jgi:glycine/D-amino acid oxidase-like deaminating enzyme
MADRHYDEIVIGGGLLGSAVAYALSRNKKNSALLIDAREKGTPRGRVTATPESSVPWRRNLRISGPWPGKAFGACRR